MTVHYGDGYEWVRRRKGYAAGNGVVVDRGSIAADERPAAHLGRRVPSTADGRGKEKVKELHEKGTKGEWWGVGRRASIERPRQPPSSRTALCERGVDVGGEVPRLEHPCEG